VILEYELMGGCTREAPEVDVDTSLPVADSWERAVELIKVGTEPRKLRTPQEVPLKERGDRKSYEWILSVQFPVEPTRNGRESQLQLCLISEKR